jgi:hypothetical protein
MTQNGVNGCIMQPTHKTKLCLPSLAAQDRKHGSKNTASAVPTGTKDISPGNTTRWQDLPQILPLPEDLLALGQPDLTMAGRGVCICIGNKAAATKR